jgi:hypothetical protein
VGSAVAAAARTFGNSLIKIPTMEWPLSQPS